MSLPFVHLRLHTEYSIEDSIIQIKQLVNTATDLQLPALALTDQMNVFAGLKFYDAMTAAGIKPIVGLDAWLLNESMPSEPFRCSLLCQTTQGYHNLLALVSSAYQERGNHKVPMLKQHWFNEKGGGLIALSGGIHGDIGSALREGKQQQATQRLKRWQSLFKDRFYLELQRMGHPGEEHYIALACQLANTYQVPVVATHDIRFLQPDDFEAHEARVCIQSGYTLSDRERPKRYTQAQYLKSTEDMHVLFKDIPSALKNSVEIAKRCNVTLDKQSMHLPRFALPVDVNAEHYLIKQAEAGLANRLSKDHQPSRVIEDKHETSAWHLYHDRLTSELQIINKMGFASYFLIVADFVRWAREAHIPVGPGRGSGAGSLVAYALYITDVDPLHYGLLFERFLNAERVSMPDFDIDFCMEHRDQVIDYVINRYSDSAVAQIITFGTMAARAVIRDVGRVLGYPYTMVDSIAKLIPFEIGMTLAIALKRDEKSVYSLKARYDKEEEIKTIINLAQKLEGLVRNVGTHAGGVVIAPSRLTDFTALYYESDTKHAITQFDKDDLEKIGLVKFDFLGLRTLTIINWTVHAVNRKRQAKHETPLDITYLPLDDKKTFLLLQSANVTGVFQLESRGIRALLKRLVPDRFEDIVALIALFRPGPLQSGMVDDFIERKHDASKVRYFHPSLESILQPTYGVILYQEQVMQIAQVLAGYSLGSADLLRRAMGKKKPAEMAKQRAVFIQGSEKNGIDKVFANTMFDLIEKFAGYGFNRSHSVAYALISYQTAWLKAHYTTEFMAAVLSSEIEDTERLSDLLYECKSLQLTVKSPHIHTSHYAFYVNHDDEIEYGLGAIKGIGRAAATHLLEVQKASGLFKDLFELCHRIEIDKVSRRALGALIYSGCLDVFGKPRAELYAELGVALQSAAHQATVSLAKQLNLFGGVEAIKITAPHNETAVWTVQQQLQREKDTLGIYLHTHPLTRYVDELSHLTLVGLSHWHQNSARCFLSAVWLVDIRIKFTLRGDRFAILLLEDTVSRKELKLTHEKYTLYREYLLKDTFIVLELDQYVDKGNKESRLMIKQLWNIVGAREKWGRCLRLCISQHMLNQNNTLLEQVESALVDGRGGHCPIVVDYNNETATVPLVFGEKWRVKPSDHLLEALGVLLSTSNVWIEYE